MLRSHKTGPEAPGQVGTPSETNLNGLARHASAVWTPPEGPAESPGSPKHDFGAHGNGQKVLYMFSTLFGGEKNAKRGSREQQNNATRNCKRRIGTKLARGCLKKGEHMSDLWDLTKT